MLARRCRKSISDRCLIKFVGNLSDFELTVACWRHHSAVLRAMVNLRVGLPAGTRILARCGTYLIRDLTLVRGLGAGPHRVLVSLDYLPVQRGCCRRPLCSYEDETADQKCSDVVSGVGMPMLTEFRLWVLSTIVMVALVIFCMRLPLI